MPLCNQEKPCLYTLHGFLGSAQDWNQLHHQMDQVYIKSMDLVDVLAPGPYQGFWEWAKRFNEKVIAQEANILLGYSLGGRLAMHALLETPEKWSGAILVSAYPGIQQKEVRQTRLQQDAQWIKRFREDPWVSLMQDWENQSVFVGSQPISERKEQELYRQQWADMLQYWSRAQQENLRERLAALSIPILWIVGEHDRPYVELAHTLTHAHPKSRVWIAPNAGHRVPWDIPQEFEKQITSFIGEL